MLNQSRETLAEASLLFPCFERSMRGLMHDRTHIFARLQAANMRTTGGGPIRFPAKVNAELNQHDIRIVLDPSLAKEEEQ
ncbi:MAG: hypothetical protein ACREHD_17415 [Pirellulales bacterium]